MKNKGIVTVSSVPEDPESATKLQQDILNHQVTMHADQVEEISAKIKSVIDGTFARVGEAEGEGTSFESLRNPIARDLKQISPIEIEDLLEEFLTSKCGVPVSVSVRDFAMRLGSGGMNPEHCMKIELSVEKSEEGVDSDIF